MIFSTSDGPVEVEPAMVVAAGFTGRDRAAAEIHAAELRAEGITIPDRLPSFYPVPAHLLTRRSAITVASGSTSGEVEVALVIGPGRTLVTLASDHTDRAVERLDIGVSKQVCPKPIAAAAWDHDVVGDRWDALLLESWIHERGERTPYQRGFASELTPAAELDAAIPFGARPDSYVLLGGTLPAIGGIRPSARFEARLTDTVSGDVIELAYDVAVLDGLAGS